MKEEDPVIVRSARRKRVALAIRPEDGRLEVRAPMDLSKREITRILKLNEDLIEKLHRKHRQHVHRRPKVSFNEEGRFMLLGKHYPIRFTKRAIAFDEENGAFCVPEGPPEAVKQSLETLYRRLAHEIIVPKAEYYAERFGLHFNLIRINGATGRWGSCSRNGNMNFSWRLIQCLEPAVDYVVIHELGHLLELNHSDRYWKLVSRMCPEYKRLDRYLSEHSSFFCAW